MSGTSLIAAAFAFPMALLYLAGLLQLFAAGFGAWGTLARVVLATMFLRVGVILGVGRLRTGNPVVVMDLLSLEMLALPVLAFSALLLGSPGLLGVGAQVFVIWPCSLLIAAPVYALYEIPSLMRRGAPLVQVIPAGALLFFSLQLFLSVWPSLAAGPSFPSLLAAGQTAGGLSGQSLLAVAGAGVLLYLTMAVYACAGGKGAVLSVNPQLSLAVVATVVSILLSAWAVQFGSLAAAVVIVPASALIAMTWVLVHVR